MFEFLTKSSTLHLSLLENTYTDPKLVVIILCPVQQGGFVNISYDKSPSPNFPLDIFGEDRIPPNGLPYQLRTSLLIATEDSHPSCIFTAEAHLSEDAQDQAICSFS